MRARPAPKLADFLRIRRVYRTQWEGVFEVIPSSGARRYRVVLTGPESGICSCHAGRHEKPCRHLVLVLMRRGGANGRGIDPHRRGGTVAA